jgi:DNA-3-methyladenine glycosylase I
MLPIKRCEWCLTDPLYIRYHDNEWGRPIHDDKKLFEFLVLEGAQAGLSWLTVLKKRESYRKAFDLFDPQKIARYDDEKVNSLLNNQEIIRNRLKIDATINNAKIFLKINDRYGSFDRYIWGFVDNRIIQNNWDSIKEIPAKTEASDMMSMVLKKEGFKFVGNTICYAYMQAVGMVNDHLTYCYLHKK